MKYFRNLQELFLNGIIIIIENKYGEKGDKIIEEMKKQYPKVRICYKTAYF